MDLPYYCSSSPSMLLNSHFTDLISTSHCFSMHKIPYFESLSLLHQAFGVFRGPRLWCAGCHQRDPEAFGGHCRFPAQHVWGRGKACVQCGGPVMQVARHSEVTCKEQKRWIRDGSATWQKWNMDHAREMVWTNTRRAHIMNIHAELAST